MSDDTRYTGGHSTPRPIRFNDSLWCDFAKVAKSLRLSTADAIRLAMVALINQHATPAQTPTSAPMRQVRRRQPDIQIEVELD